MSPDHTIPCLCALQLSLAVTCNPPRCGTLPLQARCTKFFHAILEASHYPGEPVRKEWGHERPDTRTTVHLTSSIGLQGQVRGRVPWK